MNMIVQSRYNEVETTVLHKSDQFDVNDTLCTPYSKVVAHLPFVFFSMIKPLISIIVLPFRGELERVSNLN